MLDFFGASSVMSTYFSVMRQENLVQDNICAYEISPPPVAMEGDKITIKVWRADHCDVKISYGETYETARSYKTIDEGSKFTVSYPNKIWITVFGNSILFASFQIEAFWTRTHPEVDYNFTELDEFDVGNYKFSGFSAQTNFTQLIQVVNLV